MRRPFQPGGHAHCHRAQKGRQSPGGVKPALSAFTQHADHLRASIMLALVDGEPKVSQPQGDARALYRLPVRGHRAPHPVTTCARRRERAHIVGGAARWPCDFIDEVIAIIRSSQDHRRKARSGLMERFRLRRRAGDRHCADAPGPAHRPGAAARSRRSWPSCMAPHRRSARSILGDERKSTPSSRTEALDMRDKYGDERRTEITTVSGEVDIEDLIPVEECVLTLTHMRLHQAPAARHLQDPAPRRPGNHAAWRGGTRTLPRACLPAAPAMITSSSSPTAGRVYRLKCLRGAGGQPYLQGDEHCQPPAAWRGRKRSPP